MGVCVPTAYIKVWVQQVLRARFLVGTLDGMGRPATGKTPLRNVRVPDDLWDDVKAKAEQRGETVTDVILRALHAYVRDKRG